MGTHSGFGLNTPPALDLVGIYKDGGGLSVFLKLRFLLHNYSAGHLFQSIRSHIFVMRFSTVVVAALFGASAVVAAPGPAHYRRNEYVPRSEGYSTLERRHLPLHCKSHNYQIMCDTTHECISNTRPPQRKPHAQIANDFCVHECSCRQPLGEISGNVQKKKGGHHAARPASGRRHRR